MNPHITKRWLITLSFSLLFVPSIFAQDMLSQFEEKVSEFTLDNGLKFIIVERHEAPVVSMFTYADVGGVDEVKGITGIAHMFEHMAFKGTTTIGTTDIDKEMKALEAVEAAYLALKKEESKGLDADKNRLQELETSFKEATVHADSYVIDGEFEKVIERAGGTGLNATTSSDATRYFYNLPSNKIELWFSLESDRFLNPVMREFYTERDVVMEERRMRTESQPFGRLLEEFITTAYKAHPYGEPIVGHMADLQTFTATEAMDFFRQYYSPNNLTIALVGDVNPDHAKELAETYFGRLPAGIAPPTVETVEPPQIGERRVVIKEEAQPIIIMGYHKGSINHPDNAAYDVMASVLSRGRTSRIYKKLVEEDKLALQAGGFNGFPGNKYPNLFIFFSFPNQGVSAVEVEEAILDIVTDIKEHGVTEEELNRVKTTARADIIRQLQSNSGIASQLTFYEVVTGNWRNLFRELEKIEAVTNADIIRVANETLIPNNRTVAYIESIEPPATSAVTPEEDEDME